MIGDPVLVLARSRLARAYALSGDAIKAREEYLKSLSVWKDADPDLPFLKETKEQLAKLQ